MLNLKFSATDKLKVITSSGADCDVTSHFVDTDSIVTTSSSMVPDRQLAAITTATTTDIVATPASSKTRNVKNICIRNIDVTSNDITVVLDNNGTSYTLVKCTLLAGEELVYSEGVWFHYDATGGVYSGGLAFAAQADMELATSATLIVSPANQHFHPGHPKCWVKAGLTGNILGSYNITSLTDTGTGVLTITIANDFSSINYSAIATIEFASTTLAQSCTVDSVAAGSLVLRSVVEAGSSADPVTWSFVGLGDI